jgi:hypothetical protein
MDGKTKGCKVFTGTVLDVEKKMRDFLSSERHGIVINNALQTVVIDPQSGQVTMFITLFYWS